MIRNTLIELAAAGIYLIPFFLILNACYLHNWKRTAFYTIFGFYLAAILALVGFPNISFITFDLGINLIPFVDIIPDIKNACLNVLLFVPFGFFLPVLWDNFRSEQKTVLTGLAASCIIELSQLFTFRTTDVNDLITNTVGTMLGYYIAKRITNNFSNHILSAPSKRDFYIICGTTAAIMFFLQPFVSSILWNIILK